MHASLRVKLDICDVDGGSVSFGVFMFVLTVSNLDNDLLRIPVYEMEVEKLSKIWNIANIS